MLFQLLRGGRFDMLSIITYLCSMAFVVFCTLPIHEFAHAWTANKLGDSTARLKGRMTIRPMAHVDPIGALMIFLFGFGWARAVPVNPMNFKNGKKGMALTALAGPVSNILMAVVFALLYHVASLFHNTFGMIFASFFYYAEFVNIQLAVFNLLPVPPLDGSRLWTAMLPNKYYYKLMQYERYIMIAVIVLLVTNILSIPLSFLSGLLSNAIEWLTGLPFRLF